MYGVVAYVSTRQHCPPTTTAAPASLRIIVMTSHDACGAAAEGSIAAHREAHIRLKDLAVK